MANVHTPLVVARRTLLLAGWALVFVAMSHNEHPNPAQLNAEHLPARPPTVAMIEATSVAPAPTVAQKKAGGFSAGLALQTPRVPATIVASDDGEDEDFVAQEPEFVAAQDIPPADA